MLYWSILGRSGHRFLELECLLRVLSNLCASDCADCATLNPSAVVVVPQDAEFKPFALEAPGEPYVRNLFLGLRISEPYWLYLCIRLAANELHIYATSLE